jgi:hypothetical protein
MQTKNILIGPKLGDLFHMLTVPRYLYHFYGVKSNIYITEKFEKFSTGLSDTYKSLYEIITTQPFTESFKYYKGEHIDYDLNLFRTNGIWCSRPFWAIFLHTAFPHCPNIPRNFQVINWKKNKEYEDYLIVHRKPMFNYNSFVEKQYLDVFEKYDKKLFITYDEKIYDEFPLKNKIDVLVCKSLSEQMTIINSAKMNLFNATAPITMASVLNAPRIGELGQWINTLYGSDHLFYDNVENFDEFQILTPNPKTLSLT